jgi:MFS family permease
MVLTEIGMQLYYRFEYIDLNHIYRLSYSQIGPLVETLRVLAVLSAFFLAWAAVRTSPIRILLITSSLMACAAGAYLAHWPGRIDAAVAMLFLVRLGFWVGSLVFPAIIARALGGYETFLVAFGLTFVLQYTLGAGVGAFSDAYFSNAESDLQRTIYAIACTGLLLLAVIALIPIKRVLFTAEPPLRSRPIEPKYREPFVAALLTVFVPFYFLYWLYRAHGEAAGLRPSRVLLTPAGAVWVGLIPIMNIIMLPVMLTTLADHLNMRAGELGLPRLLRPWAILLGGLFLPFVAIGALQGALNRLASSGAPAAAAPAN